MGVSMKYPIFSSLARAISETKKFYKKTVECIKIIWESYLELELNEHNIEIKEGINKQKEVKNNKLIKKKHRQNNKKDVDNSLQILINPNYKKENIEKCNKTKQKLYKHLTKDERIKIATLKEQGYGPTRIAKILNRSKGTISKEIRRLFPGKSSCSVTYRADDAQIDAEIKRKLCGRETALTKDTIDEFYKYMNKYKMSPEQISESILEGVCSKSSFYRGVERGLFDKKILRKCLVRKYKRKKRKTCITKYEIGKSIHDRPEYINYREEFGHWEADSIESKKTGTCAVCVLIERKSRKVFALKVPEHNSYYMTKFILYLIRKHPKGTFKTITCDRGLEFADFAYIEGVSGVKIYFADPHSPNQKGSVENANGLIRRFFPKGTDFGKLLPHDLYQKAIRFINHWPRKVLNWVSPNVLFDREVNALKDA